MKGLNRVQMIGEVAKKPEAKCFPNGVTIAHCVLLVEYDRKKSDGSTFVHKEWIRLAFYDDLSEEIMSKARYKTKLFVEGEMRTRKFEKEGQTHYTTEVAVSILRILN